MPSKRETPRASRARAGRFEQSPPTWEILYAMDGVEIRSFVDSDPPMMSAAFARVGSVKAAVTFERYLAEAAEGARICLAAEAAGAFAGYVTVDWMPDYPGFQDERIPEIQDLNVLPAFRRRGIATRLLDRAEAEIAARSAVAGIGVGLHPGYNVAQRMYGKRGYILDGRGLTWRNAYVPEGALVRVDDDLVLHLTKRLR